MLVFVGSIWVQRIFVEGSEPEPEMTIKLSSTLQAWREKMPRTQCMCFHYTLEEQANLMAKGEAEFQGVHVTLKPPVALGDDSEGDFVDQWPSAQWKQFMLQDQQVCVDAVVVLAMPLTTVPGDAQAFQLEVVIEREMILGVVVLYEQACDKFGEASSSAEPGPGIELVQMGLAEVAEPVSAGSKPGRWFGGETDDSKKAIMPKPKGPDPYLSLESSLNV